MAALIGGGIGDADDTNTSADSVAEERPVGDMDALPDCIRFF